MIPRQIFITGTGTGIGKTIVSAILTEAFHADYWKPVQAGFDNGTDSLSVGQLISNTKTIIYPETYKLKKPASPHIAAREEDITIDSDKIKNEIPRTDNTLVIEGAGGLMVPLNENEFVADLILKLNTPVILVSRNTLGSINHSLLTAIACKQKGIKVLGWIFNDQFMDYENEIVQWSEFPKLASIPWTNDPDKVFILQQAGRIKNLSQTWPC
ncbi:MAG: dethiobiotin synthase [Flavitalea sp.]